MPLMHREKWQSEEFSLLRGRKPGWFAGLAFLLISLASAQSQQVIKVDPPNWWIGFPNPMLMLSGHDLKTAQVTTFARGIRVVRTLASDNGHYLFVWLQIEKTVSTGKIRFTVTTPAGKQSVDWELQKRNPEGESPKGNQGFNGFSPDDVIYLIMPDRFADGDSGNNFPASGTYDRKDPHAYHGGDLRGIQEHLPYLKDLGVTAIWITPIYNNNDRTGRDYHGYGAVDLYKVEEHFGTLEEYRSLVRAAHDQGLKVILDIVPNHVGPENPWAADPPTARWLHGTREHHLISDDQFQHLADPHASASEGRNILEGWFVDVLPDLGTDDPMTSQYLRQNALWWAETGALDGFRLDTFPYVDRPFWHDFHADVHHVYPRFKTVGEVSGYDPVIAAYFVGGKTTAGVDTGVDTVFDFSLYSVLRRVILHDEPTKLLEEVLQHDWLFPHPEILVTFLGNHDKKRFMGEEGATPRKLELAFSLLLTMRGIPQLYAGDEIGMPGGDDPDNRRDFPGGFPGDTRNGFTAEGRSPTEQQIFTHVRNLLHLRQQHPALRRGEYIHLFNDSTTFAYVRDFRQGGTEKPERLLLVMNNADQPQTVTFATDDTRLAGAKTLTRVLAEKDAVIQAGPKIQVTLPPRSLSIYQVE